MQMKQLLKLELTDEIPDGLNILGRVSAADTVPAIFSFHNVNARLWGELHLLFFFMALTTNGANVENSAAVEKKRQIELLLSLLIQQCLVHCKKHIIHLTH